MQANDAIQAPPVVQVAHATDRSGFGSDIYTVYSDGTDIWQVTSTVDDNELNPIWSPDGTKILFTRDRDGNQELYVMNSDGSNVVWSPDGLKIAYTSFDTLDLSTAEIFVVTVDATNPTNLTNSQKARFSSTMVTRWY